MAKHTALSPITRLLRNIEKTRTCWLWNGKKNATGYGQIQIGSRTDGSRKLVYVHRLSYEHHIGPIPDGLTVEHICRVRRCVNPKHLTVLVLKDNLYASPDYIGNRTMCAKGHPFTHRNKTQRLCAICQKEIARKYRESHRTEIAARMRARRHHITSLA